jgi:hypothetical protein
LAARLKFKGRKAPVSGEQFHNIFIKFVGSIHPQRFNGPKRLAYIGLNIKLLDTSQTISDWPQAVFQSILGLAARCGGHLVLDRELALHLNSGP